jgi:beta-galactosidase
MPDRFPPVNPNFAHMLHGGDYNPEQWMDHHGVWDEDVRLMKAAHCNVVSIGIFSWSMLEPAEGHFTFDWLDRVIDNLSKADIGFVLATPTGAKPNWMAIKYPEIRRCKPDGTREMQQGRHNHCYTSSVYREKTTIINTKLAERYGTHPGLVMWHLSNEYGGECHCPLCKAAFREWLKDRYETLDALNEAWWARFWSHTFTDWDQIDCIDGSVHGLALDWKRFVTDRTVDFMRHEIAVIRPLSPDKPVTTNMMGFYTGLNYWRFAPYVDVISWDSYPRWHAEQPEWHTGVSTAFTHDLNRSMKSKPFILMESTPSQQNWTPIAPLKRLGMHVLSSLQAVAHGADSVMYFQWRKSRGSCEKFHGAVVDHYQAGIEKTRVFQDVTDVGVELEKLADVVGTTTPAEVAIIYDWENRWMIDMESGPRNLEKNHFETCLEHYQPFWQRGVPVDVIDMEQDLGRYKLVIAPMLYMVRSGVGERITRFVEQGGMFVTTYLSGYADGSDLCFLNGFPGPLRDVLGIWAEELDAVPNHKVQKIKAIKGNPLGLKGKYDARQFCEMIHADGAKVLAKYTTDFYAGQPAVTVNKFGRGKAYYIASRNDRRFMDDLSAALVKQLKLKRAVEAKLPTGVTATWRTDGSRDWVFLMNFTGKPVRVKNDKLPAYGIKILQRKAR